MILYGASLGRRTNRWRHFAPMLVVSVLILADPALGQQPKKAAPENAIAKRHAETGRSFYKAGNYVKALEEFKKAHAVAPTAGLTYNIGRCHERLSQWKEAIKWYEEYVRLESRPRDKAEALDNIERLKTKLGPDASTKEGRYRARMAAGRTAYNKGDYEGGIEEFKAAFDVKTSPAALFNVAKSYEKMARYEEAIDYYTQYLEIDPNSTDRKDVEETVARLRRSIKSRFQELSVASDPPGADIYMDERNSGLQGQTNYRFKLPPGAHTVFLELNGYEPIRRDFVMPDDKPLALDFKLKKLENVGHLTINVDQVGARIFIDGAIVGLSPFTQKKALRQGDHQLTVELAGYARWSQNVEIQRDKTSNAHVELERYDPVKDSTLSSWGFNLILAGVIGGTAGVGLPIVYKEFLDDRARFEALGPANAGEGFYRGPDAVGTAKKRTDGRLDTLKDIQFWSIVGGSTLVAAGLGFYIYKWARTTPPPAVTASLQNQDEPWLEVTSFGLTPTPQGASFGLTGSF